MNYEGDFRVSIRKVTQAVALAVPLFIMGCAGSGPAPTAKLEDVIAKESSSQAKIKDFNDRLYAGVQSGAKLEDYKLGEGDLIQVVVFGAEELKRETRVGQEGNVTLPLVGPVAVKGLTLREAGKKIEDAYGKKYLENPHVDLVIKERINGKATVLGSVQKPGTLDCFGRPRLLDMLAQAGGLHEKAGRTVQVKRPGEDPAHPSTTVVDLDELVFNGHSELNIEIQAGDVLFVPEAGTIYVDGAVRKPGNYALKPGMTVQEAVVVAGGYGLAAERVKLVHNGTDGNKEVVEMKANDVRAGSHGSLKLQDKDIVFVEVNRLESLVYSVQFYLASGLVGFGYRPPQ